MNFNITTITAALGWFLLIVCVMGLGLIMQYVMSQRDEARAQLNVLSLQVTQQNNMIDEWEMSSNKLELELKNARKHSEAKRNESTKKVSEILNTKLSDSCIESIKWGIDQVKEL
jgi:hypothetical protein